MHGKNFSRKELPTKLPTYIPTITHDVGNPCEIFWRQLFTHILHTKYIYVAIYVGKSVGNLRENKIDFVSH